MIEHAGIYRMTLKEYLADPAPLPSLNASTAHVLETRSAMHAAAQHPRITPELVREESSDFDLGTAYHAMLLEGAERFIVVDAGDWKTKAAQAKRDEIRKAGLIPILPHQRARLSAMHGAVLRALSNYPGNVVPFTHGMPEQTMLWQTRGVWCRARPDWITGDGGHIWDLKTTSASAHPLEWTRTLFNTGADIQAAFMEIGANVLIATDPEVHFVVVETHPPHGVAIVGLDPETREQAHLIANTAIDRWGECLTTNRWPGYTLRPAAIELPPWLKTKADFRAYYRGGDA